MNRIILLTATLLCVGCAEQPANDQRPIPEAAGKRPADDADAPGDVPQFFRDETITCAIFAEAVNHYVDMGEEKATQALKALAAAEPRGRPFDLVTRRMAFTCRVLFEPKDQKPLRAPRFGGLMNLPRNTMPLEKWPLYPVAKAGSSYFVLSEAYVLHGVAEPALMYVDYCRAQGRLRKDRVPIPTRAEALRDLEKLRSSPAWKALKWNDSGRGFQHELSEDWVVDYLRKQAALIPQP